MEQYGEKFNVINICDMILFHGSNVAVKKPVILTDGYTKDFGFGFYWFFWGFYIFTWVVVIYIYAFLFPYRNYIKFSFIFFWFIF